MEKIAQIAYFRGRFLGSRNPEDQTRIVAFQNTEDGQTYFFSQTVPANQRLLASVKKGRRYVVCYRTDEFFRLLTLDGSPEFQSKIIYTKILAIWPISPINQLRSRLAKVFKKRT